MPKVLVDQVITPQVTLILDRNEAEAIYHFLNDAVNRKGFRNSKVDPTSLASAAVRVVDTLSPKMAKIKGY